jgi:hypothetical protein
VRFEPAEPLAAYYDYMDLEDSAQRVATFIVHLSDVETGGETFFHSLEADASGAFVPHRHRHVRHPAASCLAPCSSGPWSDRFSSV